MKTIIAEEKKRATSEAGRELSKNMFYVYMLRSIPNPDQTYVGFTKDLKPRLSAHNHGQSSHTAKYKPWELITYLAFTDRSRVESPI